MLVFLVLFSRTDLFQGIKTTCVLVFGVANRLCHTAAWGLMRVNQCRMREISQTNDGIEHKLIQQLANVLIGMKVTRDMCSKTRL